MFYPKPDKNILDDVFISKEPKPLIPHFVLDLARLSSRMSGWSLCEVKKVVFDSFPKEVLLK